eukprot:scaffold5771_cov171-Amphora_coffeaeformis.AAC.36
MPLRMTLPTLDTLFDPPFPTLPLTSAPALLRSERTMMTRTMAKLPFAEDAWCGTMPDPAQSFSTRVPRSFRNSPRMTLTKSITPWNNVGMNTKKMKRMILVFSVVVGKDVVWALV